MADPMDALKSILGDGAEDKIKSVMGSLSADGSGDGGDFGMSDTGAGGVNMDNLQYLMQMRDIASKLTNSHDDVRSNLLMSLKPYMRDNRKRSIDTAVRLLNISKLAGLFKR